MHSTVTVCNTSALDVYNGMTKLMQKPETKVLRSK